MRGDEEVYGPAIVGGDKVTYNKVKQPVKANDQGDFISINGDKIRLFEQEQEPIKAVQKKSWVNGDEDEGDENEEVRKLRKEMKNGVLAYDSYLQKKHIY